MSSPQELPRNDAGEILDSAGAPIVEQSEAQVKARNELVGYGNALELEKGLGQIGAGPDPEVIHATAAEELVTVPAVQKAGAAVVEKPAGIDAEIAANDAKLLEGEEEDKAHVEDNLPAYIQAAAEVANEDLEKRAGESIPVTSKGKVVGETTVTPVNPDTAPQAPEDSPAPPTEQPAAS